MMLMIMLMIMLRSSSCLELLSVLQDVFVYILLKFNTVDEVVIYLGLFFPYYVLTTIMSNYIHFIYYFFHLLSSSLFSLSD